MLTFGLKKQKDYFPNLKKRLKGLSKKSVQVGIFEGYHQEAKMNTATLMAIHEFGSRSANIPSRPVLTQTFMLWEPVNKNMIIKNNLKRYLSNIHKKNPPISFETVLDNIGSFYEQKVKDNFGVGVLVENRASTVKAKERLGRKGQNPLISSGELQASITYRVM